MASEWLPNKFCAKTGAVYWSIAEKLMHDILINHFCFMERMEPLGTGKE
jgi:hypothetical protein